MLHDLSISYCSKDTWSTSLAALTRHKLQEFVEGNTKTIYVLEFCTRVLSIQYYQILLSLLEPLLRPLLECILDAQTSFYPEYEYLSKYFFREFLERKSETAFLCTSSFASCLPRIFNTIWDPKETYNWLIQPTWTVSF